MNPFDLQIILFCNKITQASPAFAALMLWLSDAELFKGGVLMALLWWAWFRRDAGQSSTREIVLATLAAGFTALFVARVLSWTLPFRLRPMFVYPSGFAPKAEWSQWSSFPSDHATLFFSLATGLFYVAQPVGVVTALYVLVVICLPRIFMGLHYPTDILAGALLGVGLAALANTPRLRHAIARPGLLWLQRNPAWFYAIFFLLTYQIATLFIDIRNFHHLVVETMHGIALK